MIFRHLPTALILCAWLAASGQDAEIRVEPAGPSQPVTRTLTGACIEDVNHEIYGGIDSQMLFGESFQEPALQPPLKDAQVFGGQWVPVAGGVMARNTGPGPRLISSAAAAAVGRAGVEIRFPGGGGGNAALLFNVGAKGEIGADLFDGYEIALRPGGGFSVGRHQQDYHELAQVPCAVAPGTWIRLEVRYSQRDFEVFVDGRSLYTHVDQKPLPPGTVGLRIWDRDAEFRNWWRDTGAGRQEMPIAYESAKPDWRQSGVSGIWRGLSVGDASGAFAESTGTPFAGKRSQRMTYAAGTGAVGIENRGLHRLGLFLLAGKPYEGFIVLRSEVALPAVAVALQNGDGTRTVAEVRLDANQGTAIPSPLGAAGWKRYAFTLTPSAETRGARFAILLREPGTVEVGYAFLQPGEWGRYKGLPVRKDVVEGLLAQGVTVLRYGGSMVNDGNYRWKNMTGPRELRPPTHGTWYDYSSNGWAVPDFLNLCEAMQIAAIPDLNVNEDPRDIADFLEYVHGPADSPAGRRRVADGHPQPYHLEYLELGNEERIDDAYVAKFAAIAEQVWARGAKPVLIAGDFSYGDPVTDPYKITGSGGAPSLAGHQKILALAKAHDREVWFDMHVWTSGLWDHGTIDALPSVLTALTRLADGARFKVGVFELNADNHSVARALSNAFAINRFTRLGGQVPVICSANGLQVDGANDNSWDQGLLFFNAEKTWPQPPWHVTRMLSQSWLPLTVPATSSDQLLDATALTSADHKVLQLNVVNRSPDKAFATRIVLGAYRPVSITAAVTSLSGPGDAVNTAEDPKRIAPVESTWAHGLNGGIATYSFPPLSFTIIRFE
jgi:hypothetical protein